MYNVYNANIRVKSKSFVSFVTMSNRSVFNFLKNQSRRVLSTMVQAILVKIQVTGTEI